MNFCNFHLCHPEGTRWRVREGPHETFEPAAAWTGLAYKQAVLITAPTLHIDVKFL